MKKSTIIHVVVMVVAVIAASLLASKLTADQKALLPEKATMSKMPVGGFHKFMADVEWMLFINYMGSQSTVDETNIDEVTRRLERLIALDPNLDKLYQDGVSSISVADPEKTVELLKRACENHHLKNNAEIPFYQACELDIMIPILIFRIITSAKIHEPVHHGINLLL